jgi:hypothetical protein
VRDVLGVDFSHCARRMEEEEGTGAVL